jgi:hypothetical protein
MSYRRSSTRWPSQNQVARALEPIEQRACEAPEATACVRPARVLGSRLALCLEHAKAYGYELPPGVYLAPRPGPTLLARRFKLGGR